MRRYVISIRTTLKEIVVDLKSGIDSIQNRGKWTSLVNAALNLGIT